MEVVRVQKLRPRAILIMWEIYHVPFQIPGYWQKLMKSFPLDHKLYKFLRNGMLVSTNLNTYIAIHWYLNPSSLRSVMQETNVRLQTLRSLSLHCHAVWKHVCEKSSYGLFTPRAWTSFKRCRGLHPIQSLIFLLHQILIQPSLLRGVRVAANVKGSRYWLAGVRCLRGLINDGIRYTAKLRWIWQGKKSFKIAEEIIALIPPGLMQTCRGKLR